MNQDIIEKINRIPIFDIMNVKGYCVYIEGVIRTFVYAADIAREAGMTSQTSYNYIGTTSGPKTYEHEKIRWDRFNHYVNLSLDSFSRINPSILPLIQLPIHAHSYIPCELALVVLMHCKSKKALDFQVKLATIIMPKIQQDTIEFYEEQMNRYKSYIDVRHDDINGFVQTLKDLVYTGQFGYLVEYIKDTPYIDPDYYAVWKEGNDNG